MTFIYLWPTWLIIVVEVVGMTALAVVGHFVVRRTVPYRDLEKHNDVTGFVLAIVGVIYAVLLAFVVIVAWEGFNAADRVAQSEVSAAADLYRIVESYNEPRRGELRSELLRYADLVRQTEWPAMQTGRESDAARESSERILSIVVKMVDTDTTHRTAVDGSVMGLVRSFLDARRERLNTNTEVIPAALWDGLIIGAIVTIAFTYLFGVENFRIQLIMTGLLAALIAIMFSMIITLDYPFRGAAGVSAEPWVLMQERIRHTAR